MEKTFISKFNYSSLTTRLFLFRKSVLHWGNFLLIQIMSKFDARTIVYLLYLLNLCWIYNYFIIYLSVQSNNIKTAGLFWIFLFKILWKMTFINNIPKYRLTKNRLKILLVIEKGDVLIQCIVLWQITYAWWSLSVKYLQNRQTSMIYCPW